jgi:hypothetical protein
MPPLPSWKKGPPKTLHALFDFYNHYVKYLYSGVQTQNQLPSETLFELNAALDHLANHWANGETEQQVVSHAFGHLKRSCLDIFKLKVKEARRQYDELCVLDISVLENGDFEKELHALFNRIRSGAIRARRIESQTDPEEKVPSFEVWEEVYASCRELEENYFLHPKLNWARKHGAIEFFKRNAIGFCMGVIASIVAAAIFTLLTSL